MATENEDALVKLCEAQRSKLKALTADLAAAREEVARLKKELAYSKRLEDKREFIED